MAQESESEVDVCTSRCAQLIPGDADEKDSASRRKSAEKKKQQAEDPLYLYRL